MPDIHTIARCVHQLEIALNEMGIKIDGVRLASEMDGRRLEYLMNRSAQDVGGVKSDPERGEPNTVRVMGVKFEWPA